MNKLQEYNELMQTKEMQGYTSHPRNRLRSGFKSEEEGEAHCERARGTIIAIKGFLKRGG